MYPTNDELENAALAAENGVYDEKHKCSRNFFDLKGNPWPGQCLVSLADYPEDPHNDDGVTFLVENLPEPFGGEDRDDNFRYIQIIDRNDPKERQELATAIRSLKKEEKWGSAKNTWFYTIYLRFMVVFVL